MYADEIKTLGEKYGVCYLNYKAPGWFLTNFDTFKARIWSMNKMMTFIESEEFSSLTKKEQQIYRRSLSRAKKVYEWVKDLSQKPGLVIVVDWSMMKNFIRELDLQSDVDSIVIAATNYDKYLWENDIIANMLSYKSVDFVMNYILS
jgi:ribosomal protein S2